MSPTATRRKMTDARKHGALDEHIAQVVERALEEDLGGVGLSAAADLTTAFVVDDMGSARARILARAPGIIAGGQVAEAVFRRLDGAVEVEVLTPDSSAAAPDQDVLAVAGPAGAILAAERTALNFLQRLSGVATMTRAFVDAVAGTGTQITDTRKTTPGLRRLEKHAVRCGGGVNHRMGLYDAVLIKENHAATAGGVAAAVARARGSAAERGMGQVRVMVEAETEDEVRALVAASAQLRPDRILLDNMGLDQLRACVAAAREAAPSIELEATGNMNLATARAVAETGVDVISVGALTHSAPALDLSLLFV